MVLLVAVAITSGCIGEQGETGPEDDLDDLEDQPPAQDTPEEDEFQEEPGQDDQLDDGLE